jgi:hypothetical protein
MFRLPLAFILFGFSSPLLAAPEHTGFALAGDPSKGFARILESMGFLAGPLEQARVIVIGRGASGATQDWLAKLDSGAVLVLEGDSPVARALGFAPSGRSVRVKRIRDTRAPVLRITWREPALVPVFRVPPAAKLLATAGGAPLVARMPHGRGAVVWLAAEPGAEGFERFPYLPQALAEVGAVPPFQSRRLWAFFDPAYRRHVSDLDSLAAGWRQAGIAAVHLGAWDFFDASEDDARYLQDLIAACHRNMVLVYAWLELPHVNQRFWDKHPAWREKTALLKDARVDWRLLMNLAGPDCREAVLRGVHHMLARFDFDGVNLAELYFDGIEGADNPRQFTPMNSFVRREFRNLHGFDPHTLFSGRPDPARLRTFLDYRAALAVRLQEQWIDDLETMRAARPSLDLVLIQVDDRFDTTMRDAIAADAARALKNLDDHAMSFIIEDPATVWHLGPARYAEIARRYAPLTPHQDRLAVDINFVKRSGRVYPTALQTGAELLQLIHTASESFARVAFYSESTIAKPDLPFLAAASSVVTRVQERDGGTAIASPQGVGLRWNGPALVDGLPWPVQDGITVWLPRGTHTVEAGASPKAAVLDFNGTLDAARVTPAGIELSYRCGSRALALLNAKPARLTVDGRESPLETIPARAGRYVVTLPSGAHRALLGME